DDKTLQQLLRQKIEKLCAYRNKSCRIICCDSGEEMLALPAPDILFLDIQMTGKNGMETARELRRRHEDTILIFVTAMSE
ncbi:MAG: response regulator, partial [Lachnospiraceae bacterium]|nr:response regulator [Lachnospiraceae bacterium]